MASSHVESYFTRGSYQQGDLPKANGGTEEKKSYTSSQDMDAPLPLHYGEGGALEGTTVFVGQYEERLSDTVSLGRGIKVIAMIDGLWLALRSILYGPFFLMVLLCTCWGPAAGYLAGKHYNLTLAQIYGCNYILRLVFDLKYLLSSNHWFVIQLIMDCLIGRFIYIYVTMLAQCTPSEIEQLQHGRPSWSNAKKYFLFF